MQKGIMNIRIHPQLLDEVDAVSKREGLNRSQFVRLALRYVLIGLKSERLMTDEYLERFEERNDS